MYPNIFENWNIASGCAIILALSNENLSLMFVTKRDSKKLAELQMLVGKVKSDKFRPQVNLDIHLQTVDIQMRQLLMSRFIRIFIVCLVRLFFIPIIAIWTKLGRCPNLANCPNVPMFTYSGLVLFACCKLSNCIPESRHQFVCNQKKDATIENTR